MTDLTQLTNDQLLALAAKTPPASPPEGVYQGAGETHPAMHLNVVAQPQSPAQMTNEQLMAAAANSNPQMTPGEDAARSAATGLQRGVGAMEGLPGDLMNLGGNAVLNAAPFIHKVAPWLLGPNYSDAANNTDRPDFAGLNHAPTSAQMNTVAQKLLGPYHTPQTTGGKYAEAIASMVPAAATGPGGIVSKGVLAGLSGAGSEAAGEFTQGKPYEGVARAAGGIAGGGLAGGLDAAFAPTSRIVGNAAGNLTDAQIQSATDLMQAAQAHGIQLTPMEAVQQVTANGTGLGRLQRTIETTRQGQAASAPMFAQRPGQVRTAAMNYADTIAPPTNQPSMIGARAQDAATTGLNSARQGVNQAAEPFYRQLPGETMPSAQYAQISANPSYQAALAALRSHPELGATIAGLPDNNMAVINAVSKRMGTMGEQAQGTPLQPGDNELAGLRFGAKGATDAAAGAVSPAYANARSTVAALSGVNVDPLKAGPLGTISATQAVPQQTAALYPRNPIEGAPAETAQAMQVLNQAAPGIGSDLTRQHLVNSMNTADAQLQGGLNQYNGANWAKIIAGNPEAAATLRAGVGTTAGPDAAKKLDQLIEVMRATGKRLPQGSPTAEKSADLVKMGISIPGEAMRMGLNPFEWGEGLGKITAAMSGKSKIDALVRILKANPDEAGDILRKAQKFSTTSSPALTAALVGATGAGSNP